MRGSVTPASYIPKGNDVACVQGLVWALEKGEHLCAVLGIHVAISCTELFQIHNETIYNARHNGLRACTAAELLRTNRTFSVSHHTGVYSDTSANEDFVAVFELG